MGNLSHGVCMYCLIMNFHNVPFTHHSYCIFTEQTGHACRLLAPLDPRMQGVRGVGVIGQEISTDFCLPRV